MKRVRYQFGSLHLVKGVKQDVWTFRYYENTSEGKCRYKRIRVGTAEQYPTEAAALKAADAIRLAVNDSRYQPKPVIFETVIERYLREELPERFSTRVSYESVLRTRIKPQWGNVHLKQIRALEVEKWLGLLSLAPKTKANIRNLMHLLFECARRWELTVTNPIELVRQSSRRAKTPRRLTIEEFRALLSELSEPYRTMAILAGCLGLRISEILGLQWTDIDLLNSKMSIRRSVVQGHLGPVKTAYSEADLPLSPDISRALTRWYSRAAHRAGGDFVFASNSGKPVWADASREQVLIPAGERAGLGRIGWHTLRHTYATVLEQLGARMKVAQELLRHADIQTTMNIYTGAMEKDKREAANRVAQALLGSMQ
jgi:integrase